MSQLIGDTVTAKSRQIMREARGDVPRSKVAEQLGEHGEWARKIEKGERRLTLPVFVDWCLAIGADPVEVLRAAMSSAKRP